MNGTVVFDKTVGNDTMFVVTWDAQAPIVIVRNPSGKTYNHDDFRINQTEHTAHLKIQGTAQVWTKMHDIFDLTNLLNKYQQIKDMKVLSIFGNNCLKIFNHSPQRRSLMAKFTPVTFPHPTTSEISLIPHQLFNY